jgi:hypothetical protein
MRRVQPPSILSGRLRATVAHDDGGSISAFLPSRLACSTHRPRVFDASTSRVRRIDTEKKFHIPARKNDD